MKKLNLFFILIFSVSVFSQIPTYYNNVNINQTGVSLKNALITKIISTHTNELKYSPDIWEASKVTDINPNNPSEVILIYGWENGNDSNIKNDKYRDKTLQDTGSGAAFVWNREHVFSNSLANPRLDTNGKNGAPYADAHNLRPADRGTNITRSNKPFATGSGNAKDVSGGWYPGDEWKGDIARMMMYMYLRYGNQCLPTIVGVGDSSQTPDAMIDLFLQWNVEDPVSDFEKLRNSYHEDTSNAYAQGNRNPFIDNPAFATQIWGGPQAQDLFNGGTGDTQAPTAPTNLSVSSITQSSVSLSWTAASDNIGVSGYDIFIDASLLASTTANGYNLTGLSSNNNYTFTIKAKDAAGNISAASNSVTATTPSGSGNSTTELLISEYVEGSSYNKAIEIANFTGTAVDLSVYTIKKQTNGTGSWSSGYALTGVLPHENVFVVGHSSASTSITTIANTTTSSSSLNFNGNDAIGLFKNGLIIDAVGVFNSSDTFGANKTLQRKSSVTSPNITYTLSEWDTLASNTFSGLGNHSIDAGTPTDTESPSTPPNLSSGAITENSVALSWDTSTDNVAVLNYEVYQGTMLISTTVNTNYTVSGLTAATAYNFSVKARDAAGNDSPLSNTVNITTIDNTIPNAPTNVSVTNITQTAADLDWSAATDNVGVIGYDVYQNGNIIATINSLNYSVFGLTTATTYTFSIIAIDAAGNNSNPSSPVTITTDSATVTGTISDLIISEYVEGSSNNKAIEIANFTGNNIDLSGYSLKKVTNGSGNFSSSMTLSGSIANGEVYVIVNGSANASLLSVANTTNNSVLTFNGNDAIGLFKNDSLIDLLGDISSDDNFAQNSTLQRKSSVTNPNASYTLAEWDSFAQDTFSGLGNHTLDNALDTSKPTAPGNLSVSNTTQTSVDLNWSASTDNIAVTGYDIYNGNSLIFTTTATNFQVTGLLPNTSHTFYVKAFDTAANISNSSNTQTVQTLATSTSTILSESYFETGLDNWIDGGGDCFRYSGSRSYQGNYSIRIRDNSGASSSMTSEMYDLSAYDAVEVEFHFYSYSMESGEDFWIRYYDGNSWTTVNTYRSGTDFNNNGFYSALVTLDKNSYAFSSNSKFRFQNDASGNADHIYIDQVRITGKTGNLLGKGTRKNSVRFLKEMIGETTSSLEDFTMYPNPVSNGIIHLEIADIKNTNYFITNTLGQTVLKGILTSKQINIDQLKQGVYFLEIRNSEEKIINKFVKR